MVAQNIVRHGSETAYENGGTLGFSRVGKPTDNAFVESFSNRLRDEWLNTPCFADARAKIVAWRRDCNKSRPHTSPGWPTPIEDAAAAAQIVAK